MLITLLSSIPVSDVLFPLIGLIIATVGLAIAAIPAVRKWHQDDAEEQARKNKQLLEEHDERTLMRTLILGQEIDRARGIARRTPGIDERLDSLDTALDAIHALTSYHLGPNGNAEPLHIIVKDTRDKLNAHIVDITIHRPEKEPDDV
jgi:hypothetical protein